jgi:hypothetical protein
MKLNDNTETALIFYVSGSLFILIGLILMYMRYSTWSYEVIAIGVVFLLLGIDASRKPTD